MITDTQRNSDKLFGHQWNCPLKKMITDTIDTTTEVSDPTVELSSKKMITDTQWRRK